MKKKIFFISIFVFLISLFGCKGNNIKLTVVDENDNVILEETLNKGDSFNLDDIETETGYYYVFDKTNDDLKNISSSVTIHATLTECKKVVKYYLDNELVFEKEGKYSDDLTVTDLNLPEYIVNLRWNEEVNEENHCIYVNYYAKYLVKTVTVNFTYKNSLLRSVEIPYGTSTTIPTDLVPNTGYYYVWNKTNDDLTNLKEDVTVEATKFEYDVYVKYLIDNKIFYEGKTTYYGTVNLPQLPTYVGYYEWQLTEKFENNAYYHEYNLYYELKISKINYYDGDTKLELEPSSYTVFDELTFPAVEKEGYSFVGWFASEISTYRYTTLPESSRGDLTLYARYVKTSNFKNIKLPESDYYFTAINKNFVDGKYYFQPEFPAGVPSTSVLDYSWDVYDSEIAKVSGYSSISAKKYGYTVLSASLILGPKVTITCIIKATSDGIYLSNEEEANTHEFCTVTFVDKDDKTLLTQVIEKGSNVIPPIPTKYEGLKFVGWDHELYGITEDITIKATYTAGTNNYVGKKIAIIGDSISTFDNYVPKGFATFYPNPTVDIFDFNRTWWMQTINALGAGLFVNNSYSGSFVTAGEYGTNTTKRTNYTAINNEKPDVILIYMGTNDCGSRVSERRFYEEYKIMLENLKFLCPDAEIIACTLPTSICYGSEDQAAYSTAIFNAAGELGIRVIDMTDVNLRSSLIDSAHPTYAGMKLIADKLISELTSNE